MFLCLFLSHSTIIYDNLIAFCVSSSCCLLACLFVCIFSLSILVRVTSKSSLSSSFPVSQAAAAAAKVLLFATLLVYFASAVLQLK